MKEKIIIGTRGSKLALWQAHWVGDTIRSRFPQIGIEYVEIKTTGDKILDVPLAKVGGKGLFVKEIEEALLDGRADIAVHSIKDVPTDLADGLELSAVMKTGRPEGRARFQGKHLLQGLKAKAQRSGRAAFEGRPSCCTFVRTSISGPCGATWTPGCWKLETEGLDAILLAAAGIRRMGLESRITEAFDPELFIPAIGQGAVGIETRKADGFLRGVLDALHHDETAVCVTAERAFFKKARRGLPGAHRGLRDAVRGYGPSAGHGGGGRRRAHDPRGSHVGIDPTARTEWEAISRRASSTKGAKAILDELYGHEASSSRSSLNILGYIELYCHCEFIRNHTGANVGKVYLIRFGAAATPAF